LGDYLRKLDETGTPTNIAPLVSHGPLRIETMGMARRAPTPHELDKMLEGMRIAAREGAFGFSTGLVYAPCSYSDTSELEVLVQETARFGGIFVVHMRDEGHYLLRSFEEVAGIALAAGAHLHISHLQAYGRMNWRLMDDLLERVEELAGDGLEVSWDRYPYLASSTVLMAVLPDWTLADGAEALVQRLRDPDFRRRLHVEFDKGPDVWHNRPAMVGWGSIVVSGVMSDRNKWMEGKSCAEIASELGQQPLDVVLDLLADENLAVTMVTHYGSGKVLSSVLCHTRATLGTDGIICGHPHPRLYGSYPRFFRDFVLDRRLLSWEEAVRKTSGLSADTLGLKTRGYVKTGMAADLVVLSPEDLNDRATYQEPAVYPEGIRYVLVNGEIAVEPQRGFTGTLSGKVLRKGID
ncbi:MAG: amidohydrolase family protein, partial [Firmicutes bacterium]|nr:amidohydrolase family protein [Candidatus Fermentithermobacillaceae bacterium]